MIFIIHSQLALEILTLKIDFYWTSTGNIILIVEDWFCPKICLPLLLVFNIESEVQEKNACKKKKKNVQKRKKLFFFKNKIIF